MKLIIRAAAFECLGDKLTFDVSILIDEKENNCTFVFKPSAEVAVKYGMPELGFTVEANLENEVKSMVILLPNPQLASELADCMTNYIKDFSYSEI
jgi:hypothetical protein